MSRPSLDARPKRDVASVVATMFGTDVASQQEPEKHTNREEQKTAKPLAVNPGLQREKTSFAIRPDVKRHLTELKLDLRAAGCRVTEAEIVETLIAQAQAADLVNILGPNHHSQNGK